MVRKTIISALIGVGILFAPMAASPVGLGKLTVMSELGQPFRGEIDLLAVDRNEEGSLAARLAPPEAFREAKVERSGALISLRFNVLQKKTGQWFVKLTSPQPLNEPFLDMLVELGWPAGRLLREYTVLLDPPGLAAQTPVMPEGAGLPQPIAHAEAPVKPEIIKADAGSAVGGEAAAGTYGPVKFGETLKKIAATLKPEGVSVRQMQLALFRANRQAFAGNNIRRLIPGEILLIPEVGRASLAGTCHNLDAVQPAQSGAIGQAIPALGGAYENLGNFHLNLAIQAYEQAVKFEPSGRAVAEKLAAIKQIARVEMALPSKSPMPAVKPARAESIPADADEDGAMIENVVAEWSDAWSRKDVASYLSYYGDDFVPDHGKSRVKWEKVRKARLTKPGPIEVKIANLSVEMRGAGLATVRFTQRYRSANFHSADRKTLVLVNRDGRWFIRNESAGKYRPAKLVKRLESAGAGRA
jgi:FimV-like protein